MTIKTHVFNASRVALLGVPVLSLIGTNLLAQTSSNATADQQTVFVQAETTRFNERFVEVANSDTVLHFWDEHSSSGQLEAHYAVSLDAGSTYTSPRLENNQLLLRHGRFDPEVSIPSVHPDLKADPATNRVFIVQFHTLALEAFRAGLRDHGITIHKYLANNSYVVEMDQDSTTAIQDLPFVRWVGAFHPAYKLQTKLRHEYYKNTNSAGNNNHQQIHINHAASDFVDGNPVLAADRNALHANANTTDDLEIKVNIRVFERGARQKNIVARKLRTLGSEVAPVIADGFLILATVNVEQLEKLLHMNEVAYVDLWSAPEVDMDVAREFGGVNFIEGLLDFKGQGVRAEVMDDGVLESHVDFSENPLILHGFPGGSIGHGTSTTGIIFGQGVGNPIALGILPEAQGFSASYENLGQPSSRYQWTADLVDPNGDFRVVLQSNSWGSERTTEYNNISATMDDIIFNHDILITQSQSNAGSRDSRPEAWAKNIVSVGALNHMNTLTPNDDCWCGGASIGPAEDGRIKPDLNSFYDMIFTTAADCDTCYTPTFGGTSGATPIVSGHFGILFQMWHKGVFHGSGGANTVFNSRPHAATAKALMINTASQYPFNAIGEDRDRSRQGWGYANLETAYDLSESMFVVDESVLLQATETITYEFTVPQNQPRLQITLVYNDPMGNTSDDIDRINDLSLKVTSPGFPSGDTYWGNAGLMAGNWSDSGGSENNVDTVENVIIDEPRPGTWVVEIIATEVNEDSHLETPEVDADFALVVSGIDRSKVVDFLLEVNDLKAGETGRIRASGLNPHKRVYFIYSLEGEGSVYSSQLGITIDLASPQLLASKMPDDEAIATVSGTVPNQLKNKTLYLQAAQLQLKSEVVSDFVDP